MIHPYKLDFNGQGGIDAHYICPHCGEVNVVFQSADSQVLYQDCDDCFVQLELGLYRDPVLGGTIVGL